MSSIAQDNSLFEIDQELDLLLDQIHEQAAEDHTEEVPPELLDQFHAFCMAYSEKVDRIGKFLTLMESRADFCRTQAARLTERARSTESKIQRTQNMLLYYLSSRDLKKIEGMEFTLRRQKNSQDSVVVCDEPQVPIAYRELELRIPGRLWQAIQERLSDCERRELSACLRQMKPSSEAIKSAIARNEQVPGADVRRGYHLRVA